MRLTAMPLTAGRPVTSIHGQDASSARIGAVFDAPASHARQTRDWQHITRHNSLAWLHAAPEARH